MLCGGRRRNGLKSGNAIAEGPTDKDSINDLRLTNSDFRSELFLKIRITIHRTIEEGGINFIKL
jgi:hypothetical protein